MAMKRFLLAVLLLLSTQLLPAQQYDVAAYLYPAYAEWDRLEGEFTIPYYPHVSIGWDNSPRFGESAVAPVPRCTNSLPSTLGTNGRKPATCSRTTCMATATWMP